MHELVETQQLYALAEQQAASAGGRLTDVYLVLGELSPVMEEAIEFYWKLLSAGRPAAGARLHFRRQLAAWHCLDCPLGQGSGLAERCPCCGSDRLQITGGDGFFLEAIDVATGEPACSSPTAGS